MNGHGGDIYAAAAELGLPPERILDFSASLNPLGMPKSVISDLRQALPGLTHYPEPFSRSLEKEIAGRLDVDPGTVLCGNGSSELIYLLCRTFRPARVLIPAPTFSEYERACRLGYKGPSVDFRFLRLQERDAFRIDPGRFIAAMAGCDTAFLCNPNNPTGSLLGKDEVSAISAAARRLRCMLVVDEAFMDFCPEESVDSAVTGNPWVVVLRSLTKFYALAGLRVGFGLFPRNVAGRLRSLREPWTVNSAARRAASAALSDAAYAERTRRLIAREKRFLERSFTSLGITFFPSAVNYYLIRSSRAPEILAQLRRQGILVRDCSNFRRLGRTYLRIAVRSRKENEALVRGMAGATAK